MPLAKAMASLVFSPLADAGHGFSKTYVSGTQEGEEIEAPAAKALSFQFSTSSGGL